MEAFDRRRHATISAAPVLDVTVSKVAVLGTRRNAWHNTWSMGNLGVFVTAQAARRAAERHRKQGTVFWVDEIPCLALVGTEGSMLVVDTHFYAPFDNVDLEAVFSVEPSALEIRRRLQPPSRGRLRTFILADEAELPPIRHRSLHSYRSRSERADWLLSWSRSINDLDRRRIYTLERSLIVALEETATIEPWQRMPLDVFHSVSVDPDGIVVGHRLLAEGFQKFNLPLDDLWIEMAWNLGGAEAVYAMIKEQDGGGRSGAVPPRLDYWPWVLKSTPSTRRRLLDIAQRFLPVSRLSEILDIPPLSLQLAAMSLTLSAKSRVTSP